MIKWVIDESQTVHVNICGARLGISTPYFPQRIVYDEAGKPSLAVVPTIELMLENLARPDSSGGISTHSGPNMLSACSECVPTP